MDRVLPFKFTGGTCLRVSSKGQGHAPKTFKKKKQTLKKKFFKRNWKKKKNSMLFLLELGFVLEVIERSISL